LLDEEDKFAELLIMADEELYGSPPLRFEDDEFVMEDIDSPSFLLLLDPIASVQDDNEESSSFEDVPLSPPQAMRAKERARIAMDPISRQRLLPG
jgi:hypothetical protein